MIRRAVLAAAAIAAIIVPVAWAVEPAACGGLVPLAGIVDAVPPAEDAVPPGLGLPQPPTVPPAGALVRDYLDEPVLDGCQMRIRPGALMTSPAGCTMNWVFRDDLGGLYIGTAGHCVGSAGRPVRLSGIGTIGTSVYALNAGLGRDFALVKIDPALHHLVDPTLCKWGGPTSVVGDHPTPGTAGQHVMLQYGHGIVYGTTSATRARAFEGVMSGSTIDMRGASAGGDSGSPIMLATGEAAGVLTHGFPVPVGPNVGLGLTYGGRIDVAMARAEAALGIDLTLLTGTVPVHVAPVVGP